MPTKTKEQYDAVRLTTPAPQRMVFQNLVEPKAPPLKHGKAKPQFSATFLINPEDPIFSGEGKSIQRLCLSVVKEEFNPVYTAVLARLKAANAEREKAELPAIKITPPLVLDLLRKEGVTLPFDRGEDINAEREKSGKSAYEWAAGKIMFKASSNADKDDGGSYKYQPRLGSTESGKGVLFDRDGLAMHGSKFYNGAEAFFVVQFAGFLVDGKRYVKAYLEKVFVTGKGEKLGNGGADEFDQYLGKTTNENPVDDLADVL